MIKRINPTSIQIALDLALFKAEKEVEQGFKDWPDSPYGVEVSWEDFKKEYDSLVFLVRGRIMGLLGKLPDVDLSQRPLPEPQKVTVEDGRYHGRHNGDRPMWYFSKPMRDYPQKFTVEIDGCDTVEVNGHDGNRFVAGATIIKQSDVSGRGMAVITSAACHSETAHIVLGEVEPVEPETYNTIDIVRNLRFLHDKSFAWLPYTGAAYGRAAKFVWPELGISFFVPDMSKDYSPRGPDHETYFCGTNNAPEVSNGTKASIFGPAGKRASFVEIHYS